ncbi:MAG TPA: sigma-70 family RNA polymerase sigma factor [Actinomycetota bacterium]|nr:sigma-70 family RNA polymerase sigma factor [Actinomycetota bacterium]
MEEAQLRVLVKRASRGDEDAAALLFDEYYPRVYRYAAARLGAGPSAEDAASETFAKVVRELGRFKWRGAGFEGWLFRIARNVIVDMQRRGGRETPVAETIEPPGPSQEGAPETVVTNVESAAELRALLDRLPPEQREVLLLRFGAGLDTNEVGRAMDKNANAIRQLQLRALRNVRAMIPEGVMRP